MSWWIYLEDEGNNSLPVEPFCEGGTQVLGGSSVAELNVTYNYGKHFRFPELHEKTGAETLPVLDEAIARLSDERAGDYWAPTEGNVKYNALVYLRDWAKQHPTGRWRVS